MDTLGERVKKIIVYNGYTMTNFAKELNISQSMVSKICSGKATPSERTISDICRIFNINKDWLLLGTGEMVNKESLEPEISTYFTDLAIDDVTRRQLVSALASVPPAAMPLILEYVHDITEGIKKGASITTADAFMAGYRKGFHLGQKIIETMNQLSNEPEK